MMRRSFPVLFCLVLLTSHPVSVSAYTGLGRIMVEKALGRVPETEDELDKEIERLQALAALQTAEVVPADLISLAVLELNRPNPVSLDEVRQLVATAVVRAPEREDALNLWLDLLPRSTELRLADEQLSERARQQPNNAALLWVRVRVLAQLESYGAARDAAKELAVIEPKYLSRANWLRAVIEGEEDHDDKSTKYFEEALESLDVETAELIWASCRMVATPSELVRYDATPADERAVFLRSFWKRRDTFPLSEKNERLGEHFRRLKEARRQYPALSNGRAYLTMHDSFKYLSPDLDFYASDVVFDYQMQASAWFDHRGLLFVRHGVPDRSTRSSNGVRSETWLYYRWTSRPLMFHLIDRRGIGEYVITMNLAQATATGSIEDDPIRILDNAGNFQDLYGSRGTFHILFQRMSATTSRQVAEEILQEEARMMAGFVRDAFVDDTSNLIKEDDLLPFAAYSANFKAGEDRVDTHVYYAIPEKELVKLGESFEFDATVVVYDKDWTKQIAEGEHHFRYDRPAGKKPQKDDLLVGVITLQDLEPGSYRFAFELREKKTDKIGVAKGGLQVDYYGGDWVDLSDLLLAQKITTASEPSIFDRSGKRIIPIPTRTLSRDAPAEVYYEIYDLQPGADGKNHYRVEYRLLEIQAKPSLASRLFGIGMNVAYIFFPYQVFLTQAGLFGLDIATTDPEKGLTKVIEERNLHPGDGAVSESFKIDSNKYRSGIYQMYVTVKDYVSGSVTTRSVRFAID